MNWKQQIALHCADGTKHTQDRYFQVKPGYLTISVGFQEEEDGQCSWHIRSYQGDNYSLVSSRHCDMLLQVVAAVDEFLHNFGIEDGPAA